jgi:hypothetical protein
MKFVSAKLPDRACRSPGRGPEEHPEHQVWQFPEILDDQFFELVNKGG